MVIMRNLNTAAVLLLLCVSLGPATAGAQECMATSTAEQVESRLQAAEEAFSGADADAFVMALEEVALLVPCLGEPLPPSEAARMHRLEGIRTFIQGESEASQAALRAARVLEPSYRFPETLLAADHDLRLQYSAMDPTDARTRRVPEPRVGNIAFDGAPTRARPSDRSTVVQLLDAQQRVFSTSYLGPDDPLPDYRAIPRIRNRLLITSATSLAGAGVFYGLAWSNRSGFWEDDPDYVLSDLEAMQSRSRLLVAVSGTFGAIAIGGGIGAAVVGER